MINFCRCSQSVFCEQTVSVYTLSEDAFAELNFMRDCLEQLPDPPLTTIKDCGPFGVSFTFEQSVMVGEPSLARLARLAHALAMSLYNLRPKVGCALLENIIPPTYSAATWRKLWALVRDAMHKIVRANGFALYAPLSESGRAINSFPIHSDLYGNCWLVNVFDQIEKESLPAGRPQLLNVDLLLKALRFQGSSGIEAIKRLRRLYKSSTTSDGFNEIIRVLHSVENEWYSSIQRVIAQNIHPLSLTRGGGYLINDRVWLHGRESLSQPASPFRVHRLVIGESRLTSIHSKTEHLQKSILMKSPSLEKSVIAASAYSVVEASVVR